MGLLNRLGLRRPDPPRCFAEGRFQIAGATVINPMHDRRAGATLDISSGAIAGISDTAAVPPSEFAGCFRAARTCRHACPFAAGQRPEAHPGGSASLPPARRDQRSRIRRPRWNGRCRGAKIRQRGRASGAAGVLLRSLCRRRQGNFQEHDPAGGREPGGGRCRRTPGQG